MRENGGCRPESPSSAKAVNHEFSVVIDGAETIINEGVLRCNGGTLTVVSPGVLEVNRFQHVVVRGGGGGDVRFARCVFAAAEACGAVSFHRCDAVRVDGAGKWPRRCRSADVERGHGEHPEVQAARARRRGACSGRCREADVGNCSAVALGRCREARADWCGSLGVQRCRSADVSCCEPCASTGAATRACRAAGA
ncbi:hypothetical protein ZWY2020_029481 [Hordeum vulgare]|nr:hypothetical protein ZWY2020_029481 [Hordeum vulgare]